MHILILSYRHPLFSCFTNFKEGDREIKILVIGSRDRAKETINAILDAPNSLYNVVGCLELDEVIFALPLKKVPDVNSYISFAEKVGVKIRIIPGWQLQQIMFRPETAAISFENFVGTPCLSLSSTPQQDGSLIFKGFLDFSASALGIAVISPLLLIIAALIKITSKRTILFAQDRVGVNGRPFTMYKFRSMVANAEELRDNLSAAKEMEGPVFKIENDPRVTPIGRLLRKTSLDELPQLFNVLKDEMSLVGPRPPLPKEVDEYLPCQRRRLSMRPGITCIWQVSGRNNITFEEWMKLDLKYIDEWSLWLDFKLLLLTIRAVVTGTGK